MPTLKKRMNVSLPDEVERAIALLAKRDDVPQATKALHLIEMALEIEEDAYFSKIADERAKKGGKFLSDKEFWSEIL